MNRTADYFFAVFFAFLGFLILFFVVALGAAGYFTVQCYRSGNPDSMACFMANGHTSRVKVDATIK